MPAALFELHPHYQLAYSKDTGCQWVFCQRCHQVYELSLNRHVLACACGARTRIHCRDGASRAPSGVRPAVTPVRSRLGGIVLIALPPGACCGNISHRPLKGYAGALRQPPMRTASAMTKPRTPYMPSGL